MRLANNRSGYLFTNAAGEEVRLMRRSNGRYARVRNASGNYLDASGNPWNSGYNSPTNHQQMTRTTGELTTMQSQLRKYSNFEECVITNIAWEDFGTAIAITFDYIWKANGRIRGDNEDRVLVTLRFKVLQEFMMYNQLRPALLNDLSNLNWSFAEISQLVVQDDERSAKYVHPKFSFHHGMIQWEEGVWMDLVFAQLEFAEASAPHK